MQQLQALSLQRRAELANACDIAARSIKAGNEAQLDRVNATGEDDWKRRGCCPRCQSCGRGARDDHRHRTANQFGRQGWQPFIPTLRPPVFDRHVSTFDKPTFVQAPAECRNEVRGRIGRLAAQKPNHRHCWLLRPRRERPRRRACKSRNEFAPFHGAYP